VPNDIAFTYLYKKTRIPLQPNHRTGIKSVLPFLFTTKRDGASA